MPVCTIKLKSVTATQLWMVINMIDPRFFFVPSPRAAYNGARRGRVDRKTEAGAAEK